MILLVNDDGIHAPGLRELYTALRKQCKQPVLAVAPATEHSGQSQAITLDRALTITPVHSEDFFGFSIDGTPTDCVKIALDILCPSPPLLVVSGINNGPNVGRSIFYSGTVGAALESCIENQSAALALSKDHGDEGSWTEAAEAGAELALVCLKRQEFRGYVLNCNFPNRKRIDWEELLLCPHGHDGFDEHYVPIRENNRVGWHLRGTRVENIESEDDAALLSIGHPTATILAPNMNVTMKAEPAIDKRIKKIARKWIQKVDSL